jgi:hypothetical protein
MGVVIDLRPAKAQANAVFTFAERQLADRLIDLNGDLRAVALRLLAVDRGRARWPIPADEQATLATRLVEIGRQLRAHAGGDSDGAA